MRAFIATLLQLLIDHEIPYAIGGSIASSYYGEARTTQDIDLSIMLVANSAGSFAAAIEALGWYVPHESMQHAIAEGGAFSINDGFWKADLFVIQGDAFALEAFQRRRQGAYNLTGQQAWFLAPEDIILHKLRWCAGKPLDKHVRDIVAILGVWHDDLDLAYMARWVTVFEAGELWAGILETFRRNQDE